jgi:circadian clock protein KaiC
MSHSNQIREFLLTDHGVELQDVYVGPEGVLTGSLRLAREARERPRPSAPSRSSSAASATWSAGARCSKARIAAQRAGFEAELEELRLLIAEEEAASELLREGRSDMAKSRRADALGALARPGGAGQRATR